MTAETKLEGLVFDLPDEAYHGEKGHYSSTQFKDALKDIEYFHDKYVTGEIVEEVSSSTQNNFDIGHAYHCLTLEPHKFDEGFAVFSGAVKRGKAYDTFKEENEGKKILSQKQYNTAKFIADAADKNQVSSDLRSEGLAEVSLFVELHGVKVKVRADWISFTGEFNEGIPYIMDMKSTTGNPKDKKKVVKKIEDMGYELSAALYLDAFNEYLGKKGEPLIEQFKWSFESKDLGTSKVYTATEQMIEVGRKKYMEGLKKIKAAKAAGWVFTDTDDFIEPSSFAKIDWLEDKEEDLL